MALFNVYHGIEYVRDFFRRPTVSYAKHPNVDMDINALRLLSDGALFIRSSNRKNYWYLFIRDLDDAELIKSVLARNGVRASLHFSQYRYRSEPVYRVLYQDFVRNANVTQFLKDVSSHFYPEDWSITQKYVDQLREEMKIKTK